MPNGFGRQVRRARPGAGLGLGALTTKGRPKCGEGKLVDALSCWCSGNENWNDPYETVQVVVSFKGTPFQFSPTFPTEHQQAIAFRVSIGALSEQLWLLGARRGLEKWNQLSRQEDRP